MITKRQDAPEAGAAYQRAYEICQQLGEVPQLFTTLAGLRRFYAGRAELYTTREIAQQMLTIAQHTGEPALLVESHHALGNTLYYLGEFAPAQAQVEQGIAIHDPQQHRSLAFVHGLDPGVQCRNFAANVLWLLGYPEQARRRSPEALAVAREGSHPHTTLFALVFSLILYHLRKDWPVVQERAEAIMAFCTEHDLPLHYLVQSILLQNWALYKQGQKDDNAVLIPEGFHAWRTVPPGGGWHSWVFGLLAEMYAEEGNAEEGLAVLARMLEMVEKGGDRWYEAELYRLKGQLMLQSKVQGLKSKVEKEAEECFHRAIEVARKQRAKSLELRAATSLARLWQQQGKRQEAHDLLSEIYGWFTEGFDTKDLQEAKTLLEELS
jgi:predicted ATPase